MKAKELMIGDWVMFNGSDIYHQVYAVQGKSVKFDKQYWYGADKLLPIPITPEILEKNGFKLKEKGVLYTEYVSGDEHSIIEFGFYKESIHDIDTVLNCELGFVGGLDRIHHCHVKYVHELQHALRLCGIEKEIVL